MFMIFNFHNFNAGVNLIKEVIIILIISVHYGILSKSYPLPFESYEANYKTTFFFVPNRPCSKGLMSCI